jgi:hypothetical protein
VLLRCESHEPLRSESGHELACELLIAIPSWSGLASKPTSVDKPMMALLAETEEYGHGPGSKAISQPTPRPLE